MKLALGAACAMLFIALAPAHAASSTPKIDPKAAALLNQADQTLYEHQSYSASFTWDCLLGRSGEKEKLIGRSVGTVRILKPNYIRVEACQETQTGSGSWQKGDTDHIYASNGTSFYNWAASGNIYWESPSDPHGANVRVGYVLPVRSFFTANASSAQRKTEWNGEKSVAVRLLPPQVVDGIRCQVVQATAIGDYAGDKCAYKTLWCIGPDHLVHRYSSTDSNPDHISTLRVTMSHIKTDLPCRRRRLPMRRRRGRIRPSPIRRFSQTASRRRISPYRTPPATR